MFGITGNEILSGLRRYAGRFAGGVPVIGNQLERQISPTYSTTPQSSGTSYGNPADAGDYATPGSAGAASIARAQGAGATPTATPTSTSRRRGIYGIAQDFIRGGQSGQGGTRY